MYEYNDSGDPLRYYVHGVSYIDERLAMVNCYETTSTSDDRPYYYVLDRMYHVRFIVDRAGAIIERYSYTAYGKPAIRESVGRGDMWDFGTMDSDDDVRFAAALSGAIFDPRADIDDDGDVDNDDTTLYADVMDAWQYGGPTVAQAFSDIGNPYMFQGVPNFVIDTLKSATSPKFTLNHHRARFAEPVTGRWVTRDPIAYNGLIGRPWQSDNTGQAEAEFFDGEFQGPHVLAHFEFLNSTPSRGTDPTGFTPCQTWCQGLSAQRAFAGGAGAVTGCCTEGACGCRPITCWRDGGSPPTACPNTCILRHEEQRVADAKCGFTYVWLTPKCEPQYDYSESGQAARDCRAYTANVECRSTGGECEANPGTPYTQRLARCLQRETCGGRPASQVLTQCKQEAMNP